MDKLYQVFNQYLETLRCTLSPEEFDAVVPDTVSLMGDFGLEPSIAFMIGRASIAHAIAESDAAKKAEQQARRSSHSAAANGDVTMADVDEKDVKTEEVTSPPTDEKPMLSLTESDAEMKSVAHANGVDTATPTPSPESHWHPILTPLIEKTRDLLGDKLEQRTRYSNLSSIFHNTLLLSQIPIDTMPDTIVSARAAPASDELLMVLRGHRSTCNSLVERTKKNLYTTNSYLASDLGRVTYSLNCAKDYLTNFERDVNMTTLNVNATATLRRAELQSLKAIRDLESIIRPVKDEWTEMSEDTSRQISAIAWGLHRQYIDMWLIKEISKLTSGSQMQAFRGKKGPDA
ncbi:hypothetical protein D6D25_09165, partial [Aureobasidium pullulans]